MILEKIISQKIEDIEKRKKTLSEKELRQNIKIRDKNVLKQSLMKPGVRLIAEVKRASPSKGILRHNLDPVQLAKTYEKAGAAAISVLTEQPYFLGTIKDLTKVKSAVSLPVLQKDFILDPYQIYEANVLGADAILLIACILSKEKLKHFICLAKSLGLDPLVEVHNKAELEKALACEAEIIGINNRDLFTFQTTIRTTMELAPKIPKDKLIVSESGIFSKDDVEKVRQAGAKGILVGEGLVKSENVLRKIQELSLGDSNHVC